MRLGALLLTSAALTAQSTLPWDGQGELPWETSAPTPPPAPLAPEPATAASALRHVALSGDGSLRISDARGQIVLRTGLPGRPLQILRDAGTPMTLAEFPARFEVETPLAKGLGNLPLAGGDFRKALRGLLWILDDGERCITVLHPSTRQLVYLPLPPGQNWDIRLRPDRLEIAERTTPSEDRPEATCWSIPWLVLLPQLVRLSVPAPLPPQGTAFRPFP